MLNIQAMDPREKAQVKVFFLELISPPLEPGSPELAALMSSSRFFIFSNTLSQPVPNPSYR